MPLFRLATNASIADDARLPLAERFSKLTAEILGKPESYVMVQLAPDTTMLFGGTPAPTAFFEVFSLGEISGAQAKRFSAEVSAMLQEGLDIAPSRIYSAYHPWDRRDLWGYDGGTF